jgi:hypothetical protein
MAEGVPASVRDVCIQQCRAMLASQEPLLNGQGYNLLQSFVEAATDLFSVGVMWRALERLGEAENARDHAFDCLLVLLRQRPGQSHNATRRVAELRKLARRNDGLDTPPVIAGYWAEAGDGSLRRVLDWYRAEPTLGAAPQDLAGRLGLWLWGGLALGNIVVAAIILRMGLWLDVYMAILLAVDIVGMIVGRMIIQAIVRRRYAYRLEQKQSASLQDVVSAVTASKDTTF